LALASTPNHARFSAVSTFGSLPFWTLRLPRSSPASARYELWDCSHFWAFRLSVSFPAAVRSEPGAFSQFGLIEGYRFYWR